MFLINVDLPSGRTVNVRELDNKVYRALTKYVGFGDYIGFYKALDTFIKETVPDIENISLYDKLYIYISIYCYSVRSTLNFGGGHRYYFMNQESQVYDMFDTLVEMKETYTLKFPTIDLDTKIGQVKFKLQMPTKLDRYEENVIFDPISAVKCFFFNGEQYTPETPEERKQIEDKILTPDNFNSLIAKIVTEFNTELTIIPERFVMPLLSPHMFTAFAKCIFDAGVEYHYDIMYAMTRHLNVSPPDFDKMTPLDTMILWNKFIEEKNREKEEREKNNNNSSPGLTI